MLLHRVITALILLPLVIYGVLNLDNQWFAIVLGGVILLGTKEWWGLAGYTAAWQKAAFSGAVIAALLAAYWLLPLPGVAPAFFLLITLGWVFITIFIIRYDPQRASSPNRFVKSLIGLFVLVPTWAALISLHGLNDDGPALVLFCMSLSWVADTGAYFAGRQWGNVKLAPAISPKKTREGVYGALLLVGLWSGLLIGLRPETGAPWAIVLVCLLVCVISVVGDLYESLLKRQAGIKDSGQLLPGHGGILDRIDSLTAVAPVFLFGLYLLGGLV